MHKTTVHRRWGSPEGLIADALELAENELWPIPNTGSLDDDLRRLTDLVRTGFADLDAGPVASAFVAAAVQHSAAAEALGRFYAARHAQSAEVVRRAIARGDLPDTVDVEEVIRIAVAPIYYRLFITHEPVTTQDTLRAADTALAAARAGAI